MKILVSGATGFIGSNLCKELIKKDHNVYGTAYIENTDKISEILEDDKFNLIEINLLKYEEYFKLPNDIDIVFHMASQQPSHSGIDFNEYLKGNVIITRNLLNYYQEKSLKLFIFSSTCTILSQNNEILSESSKIIFPIHDYALTKYFAETIVENYSNNENFKTVILRYPSVYGKGQYGGIIHYYYEQARDNKDIEVYSMGKPQRNVIHVSDIVKSNLLTIEKLDHLSQHELFLIGAEDSMTMKSIASYIIAKLQSKSKIILVSKETISNRNVVIDISKTKNILDFRPMKITEGIDLYIKELEDY